MKKNATRPFPTTNRQQPRSVGWLLGVVAALTLASVLASCEQDNYDKGDGKYSLMRADLAEAHSDMAKRIDYFITDDGDSLTLKQPYTSKWIATADSTYRTIVYYNTAVGGTEVEPISISRVTTASPHPLSYFKSGVKTDPVKFESIWISKNRRYLNLSLLLMVGTTSEDNASHKLGVVSDTIAVNDDGRTICRLRLYHDQGGIPEYYSQRMYFSIPLRGIAADSVSMAIQTYDGLLTKTCAY